MPAPIAHPAASIPFARVGLVFSALVIGSIAPDFGYFVPLPESFFMYTVPGLILFDVPVGLVLLCLFHALLKWPLLALLPSSLQRRLFQYAQRFSFGPFKRFLLILLSLLVGSSTHLIWDSFTHDYGWTVEQFSVLRDSIEGLPLYTILQNLGSLVGIGILMYWFIRWLPTTPQGDQLLPHFSMKFQLIFYGLAVVSLSLIEGRIIYLRLLAGSRFIGGHFLMVSTIFSAVFITSVLVCIYCMFWMITFYKTLPPANRTR